MELNSYIIYNKDSYYSRRIAQNTLRSAVFFGNLKPTLWDGVNRVDAFELLKELGMTPDQVHLWDDIFYPPSVVGCFLSHFKLWERSIEINERILILEHDVVFEKPFIDYGYTEGVVNVGRPLTYNFEKWDEYSPDYQGIIKRDISKCEKPHKFYFWTHRDEAKNNCLCNRHWLVGAHAYIVTPNSARLLLDKAYDTKLILPADVFIDLDTVDIYDSLPYVCYQHKRFSLIDKKHYGIYGDIAWRKDK